MLLSFGHSGEKSKDKVLGDEESILLGNRLKLPVKRATLSLVQSV